MSTTKISFASATLSATLAMGLGFTTLAVCTTNAWADGAPCTAGENNVTSLNTTTQIYAALNNAANGTAALVTANATGMTSFQLAVLGLQSQWVADNGIYGAMAINSGLAASNMSAVLGKTCTSATVTVNAAGMSDEQLAVLVANLSKIDVIDGLESGKTLLVDANGVGAIVVNGAGTVRISAAAALANTANVRGIACVLEFAPGFSVGNGGRLVANPGQVSGIAIGGSGDGAVSVFGDITADTDLSTIAAAVDFNADGDPAVVIPAGSTTLKVKPSDAHAKMVVGNGTLQLSAAVTGEVWLRHVASSVSLVIPGVAQGGIVSLRAEQANNLSLSGAGTVEIDGSLPIVSYDVNFRGIVTAGISFEGLVGAGRVISINASQAGITVRPVSSASIGSVSILGTPNDDVVNPTNISAPILMDLLAGNDSGTGTGVWDTLNGGDGNDTLNGGSGPDVMNGGAGENSINGGVGNDAAVVDAAFADATFTVNGSTVVVSRSGGVVDTLTNVEEIRFSDRTVRVVGAGGYASLNAALFGAPADVMFVGASYVVDDATGSDYSFLSRLVAASGSSLSVSVSSLDATQLAALQSRIGLIAGDGIVAGSMTIASSISGWEQLLAKVAESSSVAVNASGMDSTARGVLLANIARIDSISGLSLDSSDNAARIAALLGKSNAASASVVADGMGYSGAAGDQMNAVAAALEKISSISGNVDVRKALANLDGFLVACAAGNASTVTVNASGMDHADLVVLVARDAKVDAISNLTVTADETATDLSTLLAKASGATVVASSMAYEGFLSGDQMNAVSGKLANVATITGNVIVRKALTNLDAFLAKCADGDGSMVGVNASGMDHADLAVLVARDAKVDAISSLTVTSAESAAELSTLLAKASGATVVADGMGYAVGNDQLNAVAAKLGGVGTIGGAVSITDALSETNFAAFVGKCTTGATVTVSASGMSHAKRAVLALNVAKIDSLAGLSLNAEDTDAEIAALLAITQNAQVDVTGMNDARLVAVADGAGSIADGGISGHLGLVVGVSHARIGFIVGKLSSGVTVSADVTGMDIDQLKDVAALSSRIAPGGVSGALSISSALTGWQGMLPKVVAASVNAATMGSTDRAVVADNIGLVSGITNLSIDSGDTAPNSAKLLGKSAAANAVVNMSGMQPDQIASVNGAVAKVASVSNYAARIMQGSTVVAYDRFLDARSGYAGLPGAVERANALKAANAGNAYTVRCEAGTFDLDNVLTLGGIALEGAGRTVAGGSEWATKIRVPNALTGSPLANMVTVVGDGAAVRGLHLEGRIANGISVSRGISVDSDASGNASVDGLVVEDVLCSLQQYGFGVIDGEVAGNVTITNSKFAASGNGLTVEASGKLDGLVMSGCVVSDNVYGMASNADHTVATAGEPAAANANTGGLTNVTVTNCTFSGNLYKGLYFEKLDHATFTGITVSGNAVTGMGAYGFGAGFELNLKYGAYSDITIAGATVSDNGTVSGANGIGLAIKARDDAGGPAGARYNDKPSSLSGVVVRGGTVSGSARNLVIANNVAMGSVSFPAPQGGTALAIGGNVGKGVQIFGTVPGALDLGAISLGGELAVYVENGGACAVNATGVSFGGKTGAAATDAENFAIAAKIGDKADLDALGRVTVKSGNVFMNSSNSVSQGVAVANAGETLNIEAGNYAGANGGAVTLDKALTIKGWQPVSGAPGYSFVLGTANSVVLAGDADLNVAGNGDANGVTANAGVNAIDGGAGVDEAVFAMASPSSLTPGASIAVGLDSVVNVEKLVFADGTIVLAGTGGSSYATLNAALAATTTEKIFGTLQVNKDTVFASAADLSAIIGRFLGGSALSVDIAGMNSAQLTALVGLENQLGGVDYPAVKVSNGATVRNYHAGIQAAINAADTLPGDTVTVAAGTYSTNLTINKRITLQGAGSGASGGTVITSATPGAATILYSAGGSDANNRQILKNVRVTGASGGTGNNNSGILLSGGSMGFFTFDNVTATGNSGHGLVSNVSPATATLTDVILANSTFASNGAVGVRTASHSVNGFSITNCAFTSNGQLGLAFNTNDDQSISLGRIALSGVTFSGNSSVADLYASGLCSSGSPSGPDGSMSLNGVDFLGSNGSGGVGLYLIGKNLNQVASPAIGAVTLNDVTVSGTYTNSAIAFLGYSNLAGVSMTDVVLGTSVPTPDRAHLRLRGVGGTLDIGNTSFVAPASNVPTFDISLTSGATGSVATVQVDATDAIFGGVAASALSSAQLFAVEDRIRHALDNTTNAPGFVRIRAGKVFVTIASGSLERGIAAASAGDEVIVQDGAPIVLTADVTKNVSITGNFSLSSSTFSTADQLTSFLARLSPSSTGSINLTDMTPSQLVAAAAARSSFQTITGQLWAVNNTDVDGIVAALDLAGVNHATYDALAAGLKVKVTNDFLSGSNRPYATVPTQLFNQLAAFRAAENAVLTGSVLSVSDLLNASGRYKVAGNTLKSVNDASIGDPARPVVLANVGAVTGAQLLQDCTDLSQLSDAGKEDIVVGLNEARTSLNAMHSAFASAFPGALATDILLAGITSTTSAANITLALGYAAPNTVLANVTGMDAGQIQALATGAAKLKNDGVTGVVGFRLSSAVTNWQVLLPKFNASATVTIDADGMGAADLNVIASNATRVDNVINAALTSGNSVAQINALANAASDASLSVIGNGMSGDQLNAVSAALVKVKAGGIGGNLAIGNGLANLDAFLAKCIVAANVAVDATGMDGSKLSILVTRETVIDSVSGVQFSSSLPLEQLTSLMARTTDTTANATGMSAAYLNVLAANAGRIVSGGIQGAVALDKDVPAANLAIIFGKCADDAAISALVTDMGSDQLAVLGTNHAKLAADGVTGSLAISLAGPAGWQNLLGKVAPAGSVAVNASGMQHADLAVLAVNRARVDSLASLLLTNAESDTEIAQLLGISNAADAVVDASGMPALKLSAAVGAASKIRASGIIGTALVTDGVASLDAFLGLCAGGATVNVDAAGMDAAKLAIVVARDAVVDSVTNPRLTSGLTVVQMQNIFGKMGQTDATATVAAAGMDAARLNAIAAGDSHVAAEGITGPVQLTSVVELANLPILLGKTPVAQTVNADAAGMSKDQLEALSTGIAKVDSITNLSIGKDQTVAVLGDLFQKVAASSVAVNAFEMGLDRLQFLAIADNIAKVSGITNLSVADSLSADELGSLLGKATDALVDASGMSPAKLVALGNNASRIKANGITGTFSVNSGVTNVAALMSRVAASATVSLDLTDMSPTQVAEANQYVNLFDGPVAGAPVSVARANATIGHFQGIQAAIDFSAAGDVVNIAAGNYDGPIVVGKGITLQGAGMNSATRLRPGASTPADGQYLNMVTVTADGVTLKDLQVEGMTGASRVRGIYVQSGGSNAVVNGLTLDHVLLSLHQMALWVDNDMSAAGISVVDCTISGCGNGIQVQHRGSVDGLAVTRGTITGCLYGISANAEIPTGSAQDFANGPSLKNVSVTDTVIANNVRKGIYLEKLQTGSFTNVQFTDNGPAGTDPAGPSSGLEFNLKFAAYSGITVTNCVFSGNGVNHPTAGKALVIAARNDVTQSTQNYYLYPASLSNVTVTGGSIAGSPTAIAITNNVNLASVSISGMTVNGAGAGLSVSGAASGSVLTLGDVDLGAGLLYAIVNGTAGTVVDAHAAKFGGVVGNDLTVTQGYALADRVMDGVDAGVFGRVLLNEGDVYVTPASFYAPVTTTADLYRAIAAVQANDVVHVKDGTPLVLGSAIGATPAFTLDGAFAISDANCPADTILASFLAHKGSSTVNVNLLGMNPTKIAAIASNIAQLDAVDGIVGAGGAANVADASGMLDVLKCARIGLGAFNGLSSANQAAAMVDLVASRGGGWNLIDSITHNFDLFVDYRAKIGALLAATVGDADFATGGRFVAVRDARSRLGTNAVSGEAVSADQLSATIANFLALGPTGRGLMLAAMNASEAKVSATAMNAAAETVLAYAQGRDVIATGITSATSVASINLAIAAATSGELSINAAGMVADQLAAISTGIAKVGGISGLAVTSAQSEAQLTNLLGKAIGASVNATGMTTAKLNVVVLKIASIAANGITGTFTVLAGVSDVGALLGKCSVDANVTVDASGMSSGQLSAVNTHLAKVDSLVNVSANGDLTATELQNLLQSSSSVMVTVTGMGTEKLNVLAANTAKIANNGLLGSLALTKDVNNLAGLLGKVHPDANVTVDAAGMLPAQLQAVASVIGAVDSISNLSLTSATLAADIDALLAKTSGAVADATGMNQAQLTKLGLRAASLAADGITGDVVYDHSVGNAAALFGRIALAANVTVNASSIDATGLVFVDGVLAKVDVINGLHLTSAQDKDLMGRLLGKSAAASSYADGTGMSSDAGDQLAVLADNSARIAPGGITGTFTVTGALTPTQLTNLLSKVFTGSSFMTSTTVTVNASGMTNAQLTAIAGNIAAVDLINSLTVSVSQSPTELAALLGVTGNNQASVNATGMDAAQLGAVANAAGPVNQVTGTVVVTAGLTNTQIAALMGTVSTSATVTVNTVGMSAQQQAAVYSAALLEVKSQQAVKVNDASSLVTVEFNISGLPTAAVGMQASIDYDASKLAFVQALGGDAMPSLLFAQDMGGSVMLATGIGLSGSGSTPVTQGNLLRVQFKALQSFCNVTDCVRLTPTFANRLADTQTVSQPIPFIATNYINVSAMDNLQLANTTGDLDVATDAGSTVGAYVANPGVTASNSCGSLPVVLAITLPNGSSTSTWPSEFPIGTSTISWSTSDAAGNAAQVTKTYIVRNYQLATLNVSFLGTIQTANGQGFNQVLRMRLSDGTVLNANPQFSSTGVLAGYDAQLPIASGYSCISVKDADHSLASANSMPITGAKYAPANFVLGGGDANDDNIRDILDYAAYVYDYGAGKTPSSRSNYNRDGAVNNADFTYVTLGFLQSGATCGGGNFDGGTPRERVTVRDLRRAGMGEFAVADLNGDGWVDVTDVTMWAQGSRPRGYPAGEPVEVEIGNAGEN